jgi:quinol monooxygenase YgiN
MIHVVASLRLKKGMVGQFLEMLKPVAEKVREERGCIQYLATVDVPSGLPNQTLEADMVTFIEKWESVEALQNHIKTPHMMELFEKRKPLVEGYAGLKVLQEP